jgi:hypothetical protein
MTNNQKNHKAAELLLLFQKQPLIPQKISLKAAAIALLLHKRFNLKDDDDGRNYHVKILCTFQIGKTKMALVHFVGYSTDYDRIIPISRLRNL